MNEFNLKKVFKWQQASKPIVKKYVADLYQTGTDAPVAKELYNDTDVSFTYQYVGMGVYAVIANKPIFSGCTMGCPSGQKTQVTISNEAYSNSSIIIFPVSSDTMIILTEVATFNDDDVLGNNSQNAIEITIYP